MWDIALLVASEGSFAAAVGGESVGPFAPLSSSPISELPPQPIAAPSAQTPLVSVSTAVQQQAAAAAVEELGWMRV